MTFPKEESRVYLDPVKKDKYGLPQLHIDAAYDDNDEKMLQDFFKEYSTMFQKAGYSNILAANNRSQDNQIEEGNK